MNQKRKIKGVRFDDNVTIKKAEDDKYYCPPSTAQALEEHGMDWDALSRKLGCNDADLNAEDGMEEMLKLCCFSGSSSAESQPFCFETSTETESDSDIEEASDTDDEDAYGSEALRNTLSNVRREDSFKRHIPFSTSKKTNSPMAISPIVAGGVQNLKRELSVSELRFQSQMRLNSPDKSPRTLLKAHRSRTTISRVETNDGFEFSATSEKLESVVFQGMMDDFDDNSCPSLQSQPSQSQGSMSVDDTSSSGESQESQNFWDDVEF